MSRTAINEYIGAWRRAYAEAKPARRRRILDQIPDARCRSPTKLHQ